MRKAVYIICACIAASAFAAAASAQVGADNRGLGFGRPEDRPLPKNVLESRERMRIEKDKKDFQEMMERGEEVASLTARVERSFAARGQLSDVDRANIEALEKAVKKIREDLGGDDDDESVADTHGGTLPSVADALASLKASTADLMQELKKTSRFTISAAAIQSTNAVLNITRFLRRGK